MLRRNRNSNNEPGPQNLLQPQQPLLGQLPSPPARSFSFTTRVGFRRGSGHSLMRSVLIATGRRLGRVPGQAAH